jgi:hypothetical protein
MQVENLDRTMIFGREQEAAASLINRKMIEVAGVAWQGHVSL